MLIIKSASSQLSNGAKEARGERAAGFAIKTAEQKTMCRRQYYVSRDAIILGSLDILFF